MLRKTMIVLATAAALTGGLTADAFARGGGFGGGRMGGLGVGRGFAGHHFAGTRGHFGHDRRFDHDRRFRFGFGSGDFGFYDYGCSYGYPYYDPYSCYLPAY